VAPGDAGAIAELVAANREYLRPWEPAREASFFTAAGQREIIATQLKGFGAGTVAPFVIVGESNRILGRVTLSGITYGAFRSCALGFWIAEACAGRGHMTRAAGLVITHAFATLGLHRVEAAALPENHRSQRVLAKLGFTHIGLAPAFLKINGRWQDHHLYQLLTPQNPSPSRRHTKLAGAMPIKADLRKADLLGACLARENLKNGGAPTAD
jgi:ribosomal-protein-alanine N-acetyltransferase